MRYSRGDLPTAVKETSSTGRVKRAELAIDNLQYTFELPDSCKPQQECRVTVIIEDEMGNKLNAWTASGFLQADGWPDWVEVLVDLQMTLLGEGYAASRPDDVMTWSYGDFLYFSVITATTVGYGDILPNSTKVRMIVVAQLLTSSFLLVVAVNIVIRPRRPSRA
jgi:Ion channel